MLKGFGSGLQIGIALLYFGSKTEDRNSLNIFGVLVLKSKLACCRLLLQKLAEADFIAYFHQFDKRCFH